MTTLTVCLEEVLRTLEIQASRNRTCRTGCSGQQQRERKVWDSSSHWTSTKKLLRCSRKPLVCCLNSRGSANGLAGQIALFYYAGCAAAMQVVKRPAQRRYPTPPLRADCCRWHPL